MTEDQKTQVKWTGSTQQVCYALAEYGYSPNLVPDAVYEVPAEFGASLVRSSRDWQEFVPISLGAKAEPKASPKTDEPSEEN